MAGTAAAVLLAAAAVLAGTGDASGHGHGSQGYAYGKIAHQGSGHGKSSERKTHSKNEGSGKGKGAGKSSSGGGRSNGKGGNGGNSSNAHQHVTICHATPPDTAANGYVRISPSASGVYHGHLRQHDADIIPPFTYSGTTYSKNWDATGQAIWENGCAAPSSSSTGGSSHSKGKGSHGKGSHGNGKGGNGGNSSNAHQHVTICHATPPDTAANGYVRISPSASGVYHGHLRQHDADIIPPFTYSGYTYSQNWTAEGQAIWANGCAVPPGTTSTETSTTSTSETDTTTTNSAGGASHQRLGIAIEKLERVGATGSYVRGPVSAHVGDTIFYEIRVRDTGNTTLDVTLSDPRCDEGTLSSTDVVTLQAGDSAVWFCSHLLTSGDTPVFVNVATARGRSASAQATVKAKSKVKAKVAKVKGSKKTTSGVAGARKTKRSGGVKGARVTHHARPARPVTRAASFTG